VDPTRYRIKRKPYPTAGRHPVQLNHPQMRNVFGSDMYLAFGDALQSASDNSEVRVVQVSAIGDAYSARNNPVDFLHNPPDAGDGPTFSELSTGMPHSGTVPILLFRSQARSRRGDIT
jgi:enoyl-CoA hydratase/carnithine racemase